MHFSVHVAVLQEHRLCTFMGVAAGVVGWFLGWGGGVGQTMASHWWETWLQCLPVSSLSWCLSIEVFCPPGNAAADLLLLTIKMQVT